MSHTGATADGHLTSSRRTQIMGATIDTIAELGYAQATFARIAERAELSSTRLISYHFGDKNGLMRAVIVTVYTELDDFLVARMSNQPDVRAQLHAYIAGAIEFIATHRVRMQALMSIFLNFRDSDTGGRSYESDDDRTAIGRVQDVLHRGQESGEFREFDTFIMASLIQRSVDGLPYLLQTYPDLDPNAYTRELLTTFDLAVRSTG